MDPSAIVFVSAWCGLKDEPKSTRKPDVSPILSILDTQETAFGGVWNAICWEKRG